MEQPLAIRAVVGRAVRGMPIGRTQPEGGEPNIRARLVDWLGCLAGRVPQVYVVDSSDGGIAPRQKIAGRVVSKFAFLLNLIL